MDASVTSTSILRHSPAPLSHSAPLPTRGLTSMSRVSVVNQGRPPSAPLVPNRSQAAVAVVTSTSVSKNTRASRPTGTLAARTRMASVSPTSSPTNSRIMLSDSAWPSM
jgi:hypothetical protein